MRIGLVLGAGGVLGGAWLTGGLAALAEETGWDPGSADYVVGTSAGSMMGALLAAGVPPWFMVAHSAGETFEGLTDASGRPAAEADRAARGRLQAGAATGDRPGIMGARPAHAGAAHQAHPGRAGRGLASERRGVHRAAQGHHPARGGARLGPAPQPLGGGLRLRHRPPRALRARGRPACGPGGRGRRLVRHPRLLPARGDRRPPLRGRRRLLHLQPRHPAGP